MLALIAVLLSCFGLMYLVNYLYRRPLLGNLNKKSVLITGTDTGFGYQLALELDKKGLKVYAGCYTLPGLENLKRVGSTNMRVFQMDVSNVDSIARAKLFVEKDLGPDEGLFGVVNNAGISRSSLFALTRLDDYKQVMDVNFYGTVNVNAAFAELVKKSRGRIINVISLLGRLSSITEPYACSKFALQPYNDGLRRWMKLFGVHVVAIEPGLYQTNMTNLSILEKDVDRTWHLLEEPLKKQYGDDFQENVKTDLHYFITSIPISIFNKTDWVVQGIIHGLLAKNPKDRYVIGYDANFARVLLIFPDWILDFIFYKMSRTYEYLAKRLDAARAIK